MTRAEVLKRAEMQLDGCPKGKDCRESICLFAQAFLDMAKELEEARWLIRNSYEGTIGGWTWDGRARRWLEETK
jgi:hypothetical protein